MPPHFLDLTWSSYLWTVFSFAAIAIPAYEMDALAAFTYLSDNIPDWMTRVIGLAAHTIAKHSEYIAQHPNNKTIDYFPELFNSL